ncbi:hypothetical protein C0J52_05178 [Blattella germanica]|nr:hypothetical protein C0J52_05178 [Blattella germanica]
MRRLDPLEGFNTCFNNEPVGATAENCVAYAFYIPDGISSYAENSCDFKNIFICERATYKDESIE